MIYLFPRQCNRGIEYSLSLHHSYLFDFSATVPLLQDKRDFDCPNSRFSASCNAFSFRLVT